MKSVRDDPLQSRVLPLGWFDALVEWNASIAARAPSEFPVKIIQGTNDSIVDWRYSVDSLQRVFPRAEITLVADGRHHLLNEAPEHRSQVFSLISNYLGSANGEVDSVFHE